MLGGSCPIAICPLSRAGEARVHWSAARVAPTKPETGESKPKEKNPYPLFQPASQLAAAKTPTPVRKIKAVGSNSIR